jgi:hypothetical protein
MYMKEQFISLMQKTAGIYAGLWREMRRYRRAENMAPSNGILFQVKLQFFSHELGDVVAELRGELNDQEDDEEPGLGPMLYAEANAVNLETRQSVLLWDERVEGDDLPMS